MDTDARHPNAAAAVAAISAGFAVFPTSSDGKRPHPLVARQPGTNRERLSGAVPDWLLKVYPDNHAHAGELAGGFHQATTDPEFAAERYWPDGADHPPGVAVPPGLVAIDVDSDRFPPDLLMQLLEACVQVVSTPSGGRHLWFRHPAGAGMDLQHGMYLDAEDPDRPGVRVHVADWKAPGRGYTFPPGARREGSDGSYRLVTPAPFTADSEALTAIPDALVPRLKELYERSRSTGVDVAAGGRRVNASATAKKRKLEREAAAREGRAPREVSPVWRAMTTAELVAALPELTHGSGRRDVLLSLTATLAKNGKLDDWRERIAAAVSGWTSPENPDVQADVSEMLDSAAARFTPPSGDARAAVDPATGVPSADGSGKRAGAKLVGHAMAAERGVPAWVTNPRLEPGSPFHLAVGLLHEYPLEALVVRRESKTDEMEERSPLYMLTQAGTWRRSPEQAQKLLIDWVAEHAPRLLELGAEIAADGERRDDKAVKGAGGWLQKVANVINRKSVCTPGETVMRDAGLAFHSGAKESCVRADARPLRRVLRERGVLSAGEGRLNADGRYVGALNGVVDLHEARVLPREEGRKHLVTSQVPHAFRPFGEHAEEARADVLKLTEYLTEEVARYTWDCLGFSMFGRPSKTFYLLFGVKDGAKTTLLAALRAAMGAEYADDIPDATLDARARPAASGPTPEQEVFASPRRFALSDELKVPPNSKTLKDRSGGGTVTFRRMWGREMITRRVTASMFISTNPQNMPRFGLSDDALLSRIRVIPCPPIPDPDPEYITRMQQPDRAAAMFARLVQAAAGLEDRNGPPRMPAGVERACADVADRDRSQLDELAAAIVLADAGDWLSTDEVWDWWCLANDAGSDAGEKGVKVADYTRTALVSAVGRRKGLGKARRRGKGGADRGWFGWRLERETDGEPGPEPETDETNTGEPEMDVPGGPEEARGLSGTSECGKCGCRFLTNGGRADLCYGCR